VIITKLHQPGIKALRYNHQTSLHRQEFLCSCTQNLLVNWPPCIILSLTQLLVISDFITVMPCCLIW